MKEAIKAVLNLDYEQAKNDIRYGRNGNGALGEPDTGGEAGRQTGATDARLGKRGQTGEGTAERGRGIAGVGGEVRERIDGLSGRIAAAELVKQGHPGREVYLSRYCKIGDIVSEPKVAEEIKNFIGGRDVEIPENVVTPKLRAELEKIGVKIGAPEKGVNKTEQIKEALEDGLTVDNTVLKEDENARFSVRDGGEKERSSERGRTHSQTATSSEDLNQPGTVRLSRNAVAQEDLAAKLKHNYYTAKEKA